MNTFRVDEVARLRNMANAPQYNGQDGVIILPEAMRTIMDPLTGKPGQAMCYIIRTADGKRGAVSAKNLIKRVTPFAYEIAGRQAAICCIKKAMRQEVTQ